MLALKAAMPPISAGDHAASELAQAGGPRGSNATHRIIEAQDDLSRRLEIFRLRCDARAVLTSNGLLDFHEAVDGLHAVAIRDGLISRIGVDAVQRLMAEAFVDAADPWSECRRS